MRSGESERSHEQSSETLGAGEQREWSLQFFANANNHAQTRFRVRPARSFASQEFLRKILYVRRDWFHLFQSPLAGSHTMLDLIETRTNRGIITISPQSTSRGGRSQRPYSH
jgi:hypothetical protein